MRKFQLPSLGTTIFLTLTNILKTHVECENQHGTYKNFENIYKKE